MPSSARDPARAKLRQAPRETRSVRRRRRGERRQPHKKAPQTIASPARHRLQDRYRHAPHLNPGDPRGDVEEDCSLDERSAPPTAPAPKGWGGHSRRALRRGRDHRRERDDARQDDGSADVDAAAEEPDRRRRSTSTAPLTTAAEAESP